MVQRDINRGIQRLKTDRFGSVQEAAMLQMVMAPYLSKAHSGFLSVGITLEARGRKIMRRGGDWRM